MARAYETIKRPDANTTLKTYTKTQFYAIILVNKLPLPFYVGKGIRCLPEREVKKETEIRRRLTHMGAWSTSITGNDTAEDLKQEYTVAF